MSHSFKDCFLVTFLIVSTICSFCSAGWNLQWHQKLPARKPAWGETQRMGRDVGYFPVVSEQLAFVGCEHNGALLAFEVTSGKEVWRFYTSAPIRFAPVVNQQEDLVYVGSDDGTLTCLDFSGKVVWQKRGGPANRLVIGHERMMSAWPISTTPLLHDNVLYFVAGYWPVDGIYIHAVKATTGNIIWSTNAAQFRPNRRMRIVEDKLMIEGDNGSAVVDATTGNILREKAIKAPPKERPEVKHLSGNMTGWNEANGVLAVGTTEGLFLFSENNNEKVIAPPKENLTSRNGSESDSNAVLSPILQAILKKTEINAGYALVVGLHDGSLVKELIQKTDLSIVVVEQNTERARKIRQQLDDKGLFESHRLSFWIGKPQEIGLPPYFASLILSESDDALLENVKASLRPYNGCLVRWEKHVAQTAQIGSLSIHRRKEAPRGSANWSHEFCDASNSLSSDDSLVKAPLGLLWYGGVAADARFYFDGKVDHQSGNGLNPQPVPAQIIDGRMILQGPGLLAAFDIYTGRLLWETPLPKMYTFGGGGGGLGIHSKKHPEPWKYEKALQFEVTPPERCRASGFNTVSSSDAIYLGAAKHLLKFDPVTGKLLARWESPVEGDLRWGSLRTSGDVMVATLFDPQDLIDAQAGYDGNGGDWAGDRMPMKYLIALNRHDGKLIWSRKANRGFLNRSGFCLSEDQVFCVDLTTSKVHDKLTAAGRKFPDVPPTLYALELKTGQEVWSFPLDVYVQNIVYSSKYDLLFAPCRNLMLWENGKWVDKSIDARRGKRNKNAAGKMRALQGRDGKVVWEVADAAYHSPHIVLNDLIVDRWGFTYNVADGKRNQRTSPVTGGLENWSFRKSGCNHLVACENLVTWRCAYYDLKGKSGVLKLTGMDAGCAPTLLPAGGILNIPNFGTHHKRNRMTAMALIHRPDNLLWTQYHSTREKLTPDTATQLVKRIGYNFGAPGDLVLKSDAESDQPSDSLWMAVNARNRGNVSYSPKEVEWFDHHALTPDEKIASMGIVGLTKLSIPTQLDGKSNNRAKAVYTVRLIFSEPVKGKPGERIFDVSLEGTKVLKEFDILKEAEGKDRTIIRQFSGIEVQGALDIELEATQGVPLLSGVELIREE